MATRHVFGIDVPGRGLRVPATKWRHVSRKTAQQWVARGLYPKPPLQLLYERRHARFAGIQQQGIACGECQRPLGCQFLYRAFSHEYSVDASPLTATRPMHVVTTSLARRRHCVGLLLLKPMPDAPVVTMHLMNSRLTTMARSLQRMAGGLDAGCASSRRRSRACTMVTAK